MKPRVLKEIWIALSGATAVFALWWVLGGFIILQILAVAVGLHVAGVAFLAKRRHKQAVGDGGGA